MMTTSCGNSLPTGQRLGRCCGGSCPSAAGFAPRALPAGDESRLLLRTRSSGAAGDSCSSTTAGACAGPSNACAKVPLARGRGRAAPWASGWCLSSQRAPRYGVLVPPPDCDTTELRGPHEPATTHRSDRIHWMTERTGGVLTARECLTLARPLLRGELSSLPAVSRWCSECTRDAGVPSIRRAWCLPTLLSQEMPRSRRRIS